MTRAISEMLATIRWGCFWWWKWWWVVNWCWVVHRWALIVVGQWGESGGQGHKADTGKLVAWWWANRSHLIILRTAPWSNFLLKRENDRYTYCKAYSVLVAIDDFFCEAVRSFLSWKTQIHGSKLCCFFYLYNLSFLWKRAEMYRMCRRLDVWQSALSLWLRHWKLSILVFLGVSHHGV